MVIAWLFILYFNSAIINKFLSIYNNVLHKKDVNKNKSFEETFIIISYKYKKEIMGKMISIIKIFT